VAEYVTLVTRGGTPVRVANAFGVPYPTSGSGSLVFSDSATFTNCTFVNPTFVDPTYEGDYTFAGTLTVGTLVLSNTLAVSYGGTGVTGFGVVTSKTASCAVLAADSYKDFDNNGAAGSVTFTLPAAVVGLAYGFAVMEAQDLVIDAPGGVTIYLGALATTAGGTITSNAVGSYLFIKCRSATEWIVQSSMGTWTPA